MNEPGLEIEPHKLAAVRYQPEQDVDTLLADFALARRMAGEPIGGVVQRNLRAADGGRSGMLMIDLLTDRTISICQSLGTGALACRLDSAALAEASRAILQAIDGHATLIVVNKFSKQEAAGRGLRSELAAAVVAGVPVLTAVPEKCLEAWAEFTGGAGVILPFARRAIDRWWAEVSQSETTETMTTSRQIVANAPRSYGIH